MLDRSFTNWSLIVKVGLLELFLSDVHEDGDAKGGLILVSLDLSSDLKILLEDAKSVLIL